MDVTVGVSNRHVHLNKDDFLILFGHLTQLEKRNNLNQPTQFASTLKVTLKSPKSEIENVCVLGPLREYTQVEICKTDAYKLELKPPYRDSGDLNDSETITIVGSIGQITKSNCCIIPTRHIHVEENNTLFNDKEIVKIKVKGMKPGIMDNVHIKKQPNSKFELHLDTDDANAFNLENGNIVEIIK